MAQIDVRTLDRRSAVRISDRCRDLAQNGAFVLGTPRLVCRQICGRAPSDDSVHVFRMQNAVNQVTCAPHRSGTEEGSLQSPLHPHVVDQIMEVMGSSRSHPGIPPKIDREQSRATGPELRQPELADVFAGEDLVPTRAVSVNDNDPEPGNLSRPNEGPVRRPIKPAYIVQPEHAGRNAWIVGRTGGGHLHVMGTSFSLWSVLRILSERRAAPPSSPVVGRGVPNRHSLLPCWPQRLERPASVTQSIERPPACRCSGPVSILCRPLSRRTTVAGYDRRSQRDRSGRLCLAT